MTKRRSFSDESKATVALEALEALEALRGDKTAQEIAAKHKVHPTQVKTWKRQAIDDLTGVFSDRVRRAEGNEVEVKELHAKIGKLAVENDFCHKGWSDDPERTQSDDQSGSHGSEPDQPMQTAEDQPVVPVLRARWCEY
jgi:transposase-like protein